MGRVLATGPNQVTLFVFMVLPDKREDLANLMKASRALNLMEDSKVWRKAFELYNASTGENLKAQDMCSRCFTKVKEWLLK